MYPSSKEATYSNIVTRIGNYASRLGYKNINTFRDYLSAEGKFFLNRINEYSYLNKLKFT